ncbi:MAG: hypothetical protein D6732_20045, partial [Methanobacteriota archaeon]
QGVAIAPSKVFLDQAVQTGTVNIPLYFYSDNPISISLEGDHPEYIEKNFKLTRTGDEYAVLTINLTEKLPPGENLFYVRVQDAPNANGNIAAVAAVRSKIVILSPYPGKYLEGELDITTGDEGDPIAIDAHVRNRGFLTIEKASSEAIIKSVDGLTTLKTIPGHDSFSIPSGGSATFFHNWDSPDLKPGFYPIQVRVTYDDKVLIINDTLPIGEKDFAIVNASRTGMEQSVIPIDVEVQSLWSSPFENFYIIATLYNERQRSEPTQTQNIKLEPFELKKIQAFINGRTLQPGSYTLRLEGHMDDIVKVKEYPFELTKKPETKNTSSIINLTNILLLIVIIILIILLLKRDKHEDKPEVKEGDLGQ